MMKLDIGSFMIDVTVQTRRLMSLLKEHSQGELDQLSSLGQEKERRGGRFTILESGVTTCPYNLLLPFVPSLSSPTYFSYSFKHPGFTTVLLALTSCPLITFFTAISTFFPLTV